MSVASRGVRRCVSYDVVTYSKPKIYIYYYYAIGSYVTLQASSGIGNVYTNNFISMDACFGCAVTSSHYNFTFSQ
jgi:hypothetical protein